MTQKRPDLVADADLEARRLALSLMQAKHAALAWTDPQSQTPGISRIAYGLDESGIPIALISGLAPHTQALRANPACALMLGEPGDKGDPLTHPRLMIRAHAEFVAADDPARPALRAHWLKGHPKTTLYVDLPDFAFVRLVPQSALLNAGFGKAFSLTPQDLR
ncbi:MAG: pyridoxamine 5-phosphate oxidase [Cypionkella sp.]|uniref:HugZ family pyridoxamine 5'-phosphate oxidase n=1 Tax=Cypionkella sp. TaxID=2811411 RepID=UPI002634F291|nr:pyridoxamine 5-phosphate oxidase [Cypionkella sp.]MDB5661330.1 pyridoxamine 5-phosphate oxidase [Cypionkella sp.]